MRGSAIGNSGIDHRRAAKHGRMIVRDCLRRVDTHAPSRNTLQPTTAFPANGWNFESKQRLVDRRQRSSRPGLCGRCVEPPSKASVMRGRTV